MDHKNSVYTIVFYLSLLITCVLIAVMLLAPLGLDDGGLQEEELVPDVSRENDITIAATTAAIEEKTIEFTEDELKTLLSAVLKEAVGFEIDTLMITNDSVTIMSKASRDEIRARIEQSGETLGNALNVALKIAPETIEVDADIHLVTNAKTHDIEMSVTKLAILGFNVPVSLLPEEICASITDFVNTQRETLGLRDLRVTLKNGRMILSGL